MSIASMATIVFLLAFGIAQFIAYPYSVFIYGVAAIVAGAAMILGK